MTNVCCGAEFT